MRAAVELERAVRSRVLEFAGARSVKPATIVIRALGYCNPAVYRWVRGDSVRIRAETVTRINQWMDENPEWRPAKRGRRPSSPSVA